MFSRAVDPEGRTPAGSPRSSPGRPSPWRSSPRCRRSSSGRDSSGSSTARGSADAGVALRLILPGVVAYSVVAVLSRYIVGRGRPGMGTLILVAGLATNIVVNLLLIPRFGINGAAAGSSISYGLTAGLTLVVFRRLSGRGVVETLVVRRSDLVALRRTGEAVIDRLRGRRTGPLIGLRGGDEAAEQLMGEREPGEER